MGTHMFIKHSLYCESFVAYGTNKWTNVCVSRFKMYFQVTGAGIGLWTLFTFPVLFTGVRTNMVFQGTGGGEGFWTKFARKSKRSREN